MDYRLTDTDAVVSVNFDELIAMEERMLVVWAVPNQRGLACTVYCAGYRKGCDDFMLATIDDFWGAGNCNSCRWEDMTDAERTEHTDDDFTVVVSRRYGRLAD